MGMFIHDHEDDNKPAVVYHNYEDNFDKIKKLRERISLLEKKLTEKDSETKFVMNFCKLVLDAGDDYFKTALKQRHFAQLILNELDGTNKRIEKESQEV